MTEPINDLIDAAIEHLQQLKEQGVRYVAASPESLQALASGNSRSATGTQAPPSAGVQSSKFNVQSSSEEKEIAAALHGAKSPPSPRPSPPGEGEGIAAHPVIGTGQPSPSLTNEAKAQAMAELRERAMQCVK